MTYFARREQGTHPTEGYEFGNRWVVRDAAFNIVDCDAYRNDLRERYEGRCGMKDLLSYSQD